MGTISGNFSYREFEHSTTADHYGILNVINTTEVRDSVKALVDEVLQPLRDAWGKPLAINSGYRSEELNRVIGGSPTSQHLRGEAADVACDTPLDLAKLVTELKLPFDQMILYPNFVHISHRLNGEQRGEIIYNRRYTGKRL